jgi:cell wall-associated NlpC family hydrolase
MDLKHFLIVPAIAMLLISSSAHGQAISVKNVSGATFTSPDSIANKYARLLGVPRDSIKNMQLYSLLEEYSRAPYKFDGNDEYGVDCSGFSRVIEKHVYGVVIPRSTGEQALAVKSKNISDLREGDLIFLKLNGNAINHVGVYLQNGYFIHATSNLGIVLDNLNDPDTQARFMACGSVR